MLCSVASFSGVSAALMEKPPAESSCSVLFVSCRSTIAQAPNWDITSKAAMAARSVERKDLGCSMTLIPYRGYRHGGAPASYTGSPAGSIKTITPRVNFARCAPHHLMGGRGLIAGGRIATSTKKEERACASIFPDVGR